MVNWVPGAYLKLTWFKFDLFVLVKFCNTNFIFKIKNRKTSNKDLYIG